MHDERAVCASCSWAHARLGYALGSLQQNEPHELMRAGYQLATLQDTSTVGMVHVQPKPTLGDFEDGASM